mmetsp:Transcript_8859/g.12953  ORF Transcript_8859/g.12953 Transcript_8859/m.12953 type:complete len:90 (+) Transcript_8859:324-593(+)
MCSDRRSVCDTWYTNRSTLGDGGPFTPNSDRGVTTSHILTSTTTEGSRSTTDLDRGTFEWTQAETSYESDHSQSNTVHRTVQIPSRVQQ